MLFERSGGVADLKERSLEMSVLIFELDLRFSLRNRIVGSACVAGGAHEASEASMPRVGVGSSEGGSRMTSKRSLSLIGALHATHNGILSCFFWYCSY
jgi:hypothetical protein